MSFLKGIRNNMRAESGNGAAPPQDAAAASDAEALPDRYGKLNEREVLAELTHLSQHELTAVEGYERANRGRESILNKLRYLRQPEPLPGYDTLEPAAIGTALAGADAETIKAVRTYERKHENRAGVLKDIAECLHGLRDQAAADSPPVSAEPVTGNGLPIKVQPESGLGTP